MYHYKPSYLIEQICCLYGHADPTVTARPIGLGESTGRAKWDRTVHAFHHFLAYLRDTGPTL